MWTSPVINNAGWVHEYMGNSMSRDSPQMKRIQAAVKKAGIIFGMGHGKLQLIKATVIYPYHLECSAALLAI